jgi:YfiH family protein
MNSTRTEGRARWALQWIAPDNLPVEAVILGRVVQAPPSRGDDGTVHLVTPAAGRLLVGVATEPRKALARLDQVHGDCVAFVTASGTSPATDAAVTTTRGLPLTVRTADCVPVLIASRRGVAVAHAGWRGTAEEIAGKTLARLLEATGENPRDVAAFIGPSIGPCCYVVGSEVADRFDPAYITPSRAGARLDLVRVNRSQLEAGGLPGGRILESGLCTRCHQHLFHSHRGSGGKKGRIDAIISLAG